LASEPTWSRCANAPLQNLPSAGLRSPRVAIPTRPPWEVSQPNQMSERAQVPARVAAIHSYGECQSVRKRAAVPQLVDLTGWVSSGTVLCGRDRVESLDVLDVAIGALLVRQWVVQVVAFAHDCFHALHPTIRHLVVTLRNTARHRHRHRQ
jgi:hypothetical protein